jgi:hypothetical protein
MLNIDNQGNIINIKLIDFEFSVPITETNKNEDYRKLKFIFEN